MKTSFLGQHIGNNVIRGCFSSVFKYGDAPTTNIVGKLDFASTKLCSSFQMGILLHALYTICFSWNSFFKLIF